MENKKLFDDIKIKNVIDYAFMTLDKDLSGEIDIDEFYIGFELFFCLDEADQNKSLDQEMKDLLRKLFITYDFNLSGKLDKEEFALLMYDLATFAVENPNEHSTLLNADKVINFYDENYTN